MEQNQNALAVESDGDSAHGSLSVTASGAAGPATYAEYDSATGTFVTRTRVAQVEPVALRARHDGWTPARQRQFLEELAECGIVKEAAGRVGMSPKSAWQLRQRAEGTAFAHAFEAAVQMGQRCLHSAAFERAVEGVARPVYYHGEKVGEHRVYDTRLLLALLGKAGPVYDWRRAEQVRSDWQGWLDAVEQGRDSPAPDLARTLAGKGPLQRDEDGIWWTDLPPPEGAAVTEHGEWGEKGYRRTLTEEEAAAIEARDAADRARAEAERDALFGPKK